MSVLVLIFSTEPYCLAVQAANLDCRVCRLLGAEIMTELSRVGFYEWIEVAFVVMSLRRRLIYIS